MDIQIPIYNISREEYQRVKELASNIGVDLTDPEDPFFHDICFVFEEDGKDIPRNDRVNCSIVNIIVYIVRNSNPLLQYLYQLYNQSLQAKKQARNNIKIKTLIVSNNSSTRMKIIEDKSKRMNFDLLKIDQPQQIPQQPKQYTLDDYNEMDFKIASNLTIQF